MIPVICTSAPAGWSYSSYHNNGELKIKNVRILLVGMVLHKSHVITTVILEFSMATVKDLIPLLIPIETNSLPSSLSINYHNIFSTTSPQLLTSLHIQQL